jgi:CHAT domain-containing protein/tetratricopeptide (TPR) repeat protein
MFSSQRWLGMQIGVVLLALVVMRAIEAQTQDPEKELSAVWKTGRALGGQGKYAEALPHLEKALQLAERAYGADHLKTVSIRDDLAKFHAELGQYAKAEPLFRRSLRIEEVQLGKDHPDVAQSLHNLARCCRELGLYAQAEPLYQRSLQILEARLGKDHPRTADCLVYLGGLYTDMGHYAKAEPLHRRSLQINEARLGKDHPSVANNLHSLANLYQRMGQYAQAEPLYQRSLQIFEARFGKDHPSVATSLMCLAYLYSNMEQYAQAEPLYQRCLQIYEARLGKDHPFLATGLNNLAILYNNMGKNAKAEPLYRRSLQIREATLGKDHPDVAQNLHNLAVLYRETGQYAQAEPLYQRSLQIWEAALGPDHPWVALSLENQALLYAALERWEEAGRFADRMRRVVRRHVARTLPILSENEQLTFLQETDEHYFHCAQSVGLARRGDPAAVALSAGWVLNGKAVALQALAERALLARDSSDPATARLARELSGVRQQLAALSLAASTPGQTGEQRKQVARLSEQEQELSRKLGQAAGRPTRQDPWIELHEVRKAVPADAVLVEISRFKQANFRARTAKEGLQGPRYAAWVIPPAGKGEVRLIDLGEAGPIEQAVRSVRMALQEAPRRIRAEGEPDSEKALRGTLEALAKVLLEPLRPHIGSTKRWLLSPDAELWLVPWAALPLPDGRYAIEQHQLSYLISGRELVREKGAARAAPGRPVVLADPDYDLSPEKASAQTRKLLRGQPAPEELRSAVLGLSLPRVVRLPGTAAEAAAITPKLASFAQANPVVHLDTEALEAVVKLVRRPKALVLCTHGFFLTDPQVDASQKGRERENRPVAAASNPLLRCGLLFAGCNRRDQALPPGDDDGVLTGLEIVGTDLRGTELVVLSACETGLGRVHNGEGVAGLRQAFQLAGAQAVVATLWQVPDRETAQLMTHFFTHLADRQGKADALRQAQLALIQARRDRNGAAHPFFWAAFTLTGQGL